MKTSYCKSKHPYSTSLFMFKSQYQDFLDGITDYFQQLDSNGKVTKTVKREDIVNNYTPCPDYAGAKVLLKAKAEANYENKIVNLSYVLRKKSETPL